MSHVTTHVLDAALGKPAANVAVSLLHEDGTVIALGTTDDDGRVSDFGPGRLPAGVYTIVFETGAYFAGMQQPTLYPRARIDFDISDEESHYHVPLLLSPFAYSTYRGS